VPWRESWKYGERAFRYCQHDVGHALAALSFAAALFGWRVRVLPRWPDEAVAALLGLDREDDVDPAEREVADLVAVVSPADGPSPDLAPSDELLAAARAGLWSGPAARLSSDHVRWEAVELATDVTRATGRAPSTTDLPEPADLRPPRPGAARALARQRRSCVAVDPAGPALPRDAFDRMLAALQPAARPPWDALDGAPSVHLALFVHRVEGLAPGLYLLPRGPGALSRLRAAFRAERRDVQRAERRDAFEWEPVERSGGGAGALVRLAAGDCRDLAARLSCGQDIAGDGAFAVAMVAELARACEARGAHAWRELHWEAGAIGQVLYLEAEAAGFRGTGIGCYFDEPTHQALGIPPGLALADLYHFTLGTPVEDSRVATDPAYPEEGP